ncbi:MAG: hypothetical protein WBH85_10305 [Thermoanaerobaculia bacterium]
MLKVVRGFFEGLATLRKPWRLWIALLGAVNIAAVFFLDTLEGKLVLAAFLAGVTLQMSIFAVKGYVRLLGIGHILWLPLVLWLGSRLGDIGTESTFGKWVAAVIVIDGISAIIDMVDVGRYLAGDRTPAITLDDV